MTCLKGIKIKTSERFTPSEVFEKEKIMLEFLAVERARNLAQTVKWSLRLNQ